MSEKSEQGGDLRGPGISPPTRTDLKIKNIEPETVYIAVSATLGEGQDQYFEMPNGHTESWKRHVGYRVTINVSMDGVHPGRSIDYQMRLPGSNNLVYPRDF